METVNPAQQYSGENGSEHKTTSNKKEKRFYWLKLMDGFFDDKHIKLLRSQGNGDKMVIIYLMLQLKTLKSEGIIDYMRIMPSIEEEIAVDIGESVEAVKSTVDMLVKMRLVEALDDSALFLISKKGLLDYGGETDAAERQRRSREKARTKSVASINSSDELFYQCPQETKNAVSTSVDRKEPKYTPSFEMFWRVYPRKVGKGDAYKKYRARRKDGFSDEELLTAAKNYASECKKKKTEQQYIKQAKTFLSDTTPFTDFISRTTQEEKYSTIKGNPFAKYAAETEDNDIP